MPNRKSKDGVKVLQLLKKFFGLGKDSRKIKAKKAAESLDVKDRILLKIERAEIMAAMVSSRQNKNE